MDTKAYSNRGEKGRCGSEKFFCGRKHNFGLNCKAVADGNGTILDISLAYGASAADCVAFEAGDLYSKLKDGLLKNGYVLFGDNAEQNRTEQLRKLGRLLLLPRPV
jgi:hypothetical protein